MPSNCKPWRIVWLGLLGLGAIAEVAALEVNITPELASVEVIHQGQPVTIRRHQDRRHQVSPYYAHTSRRCPPFCVQPAQAAPGVATVAELEILDALERASGGDTSVLVVDTRLPKWPRRGMIPGAVNVPWTRLAPDGPPEPLAERLERHFGVRTTPEGRDFADAKTLFLYCNGSWCSQSNYAVRYLIALGYPPHKLRWYRGGMQDWETLGLTTVKAP